MSKRVTLGALALIALVGGAFALDAFIVSDEERIEEHIASLVGEVDVGWSERAVALTSPDTHPVEIVSLGMSRVYGRGSSEDLLREARRTMRAVAGTSLRVLQQRVEVDGEHAQVELKLMTDQGVVDVALRWVKQNDEWRVHGVRADRGTIL